MHSFSNMNHVWHNVRKKYSKSFPIIQAYNVITSSIFICCFILLVFSLLLHIYMTVNYMHSM